MSMSSYAAKEVGLGRWGPGWIQAHRQALVAGEFDDLCFHGRDLPLCNEIDCYRLYIEIVETYLAGGGKQ